MLTYQDVSGLFSKTSGIKDDNIQFHTVSCLAGAKQPKGLFVPISKESGSLQEAIANGAIAALWPENDPVPSYAPNHFPIIYAEDLLRGFEKIMKSYLDFLTQQEELNGSTKVIFEHKGLLNEKEATYDIAVMADGINNFSIEQTKAGEE